MFNIFKSTPKNYEDLNGESFKAKYTSTPKAKLLDVRTPGEFSAGSIKGAQNIDVTSSQFQSALSKLDKDKEYFVFCRSGNRSGSACKMMADQGYNVYNLAGGIGAWPR
ncbi:rhodanese-like domain-containing protein [Pontibacter mangrovi]|uniref:Rhodanese-like domain-containing protein n=1 Tax=Pontibacter mangrovi TaxID=2589816 RepID=A0A501WCL4_9BACT|nr:rhodanese-like domain-containing protein [Pontibacter mangrovi]TPE46235.1 rhodanese-like domain-containing protein [Pontibacter mangrovi]